MQTIINIITWVNRWFLLVIIAVMLGILTWEAAVHAVTPVIGPRFWVSGYTQIVETEPHKAVYLLHDRLHPQFCMLVLDAVTTVWTPRSCE